jgi:penicillin-binding protein-related factor A (putative recombinase)
LVSERKKKNHYKDNQINSYFWRTTQQQEIDYIEEFDGKLLAFEFKWNPKQKIHFPSTFLRAYPQTQTEIIHRDNYLDWLKN